MKNILTKTFKQYRISNLRINISCEYEEHLAEIRKYIYIQLSKSNTDVVSLHNSEKKRKSPRAQMKNKITLSKQRIERSRKFSLYLGTSCHGVNLHNRVKVVNAL